MLHVPFPRQWTYHCLYINLFDMTALFQSLGDLIKNAYSVLANGRLIVLEWA